MAFKVRLARHGRKSRPFYWIMAADARAPRETGKEKLGTYDPLLGAEDPKRITLKEERIKYWLSCGAQPTDRVRKILVQAQLLPGTERIETPVQSAPKKRAQARLDAQRKAVEAQKAAALEVLEAHTPEAGAPAS